MTNLAKQPTDHKQTAEALAREALNEAPEGAELLKSVYKLRSKQIASLQADLLDLFVSLGVDLNNPDGEVEIEPTPEAIRAIGQMGEVLEAYAVDEEAFAEFDSGPAARERVMELAMWYLARLGE
jgi:NTP pyrophosphatase (non-canonical NTP hydrolase)